MIVWDELSDSVIATLSILYFRELKSFLRTICIPRDPAGFFFEII